ncbi:MAG TPA: hypothetical protein VLA75_07260 [Thermoanaerobaculia bacterium]|nr:hypothetical protein [Thermoanaerobaculia bacterium]
MAIPEVEGGDLLALLSRRAAESPAQPWLFAPDGLDWRWWSWARAESAVAGVAAGLLAAGLDPGTPLRIPAEATPGGVLGWLAALGAGLRPVWGEEAAPARLLTAGGAMPERTAFLLEREGDGGEAERGLLPVTHRSGRRATLPEAAARHRREGRPVLLRARGSAAPEDRALVSWTLRAEAALVLEPDSAAYAAALLWARPTHLVEPSATLDLLAEALPRLAGGRDPEGRLGRRSRLRSVRWLGAVPPQPATLALFARLGAEPEPFAPA